MRKRRWRLRFATTNNHVNLIRRLEKEDPKEAAAIEYTKSNVLILGPTGVGKTYLVKHIAELIVFRSSRPMRLNQ